MIRLNSIDANDPIGITLPDIKDHCYITGDDFDNLLNGLAKVAREYAEGLTWRQIIPATYTLYMDEFIGAEVIEIPKPPTISVDSVKYYNTSDALKTLSPSLYEVDTNSELARVRPVTDESWPDTFDKLNAVEIVFKAGYDDSDDNYTVPHKIKQGMLMMIKHWFDHREEVIISHGQKLDVVEVPQAATRLLEMESARRFA